MNPPCPLGPTMCFHIIPLGTWSVSPPFMQTLGCASETAAKVTWPFLTSADLYSQMSTSQGLAESGKQGSELIGSKKVLLCNMFFWPQVTEYATIYYLIVYEIQRQGLPGMVPGLTCHPYPGTVHLSAQPSSAYCLSYS